MLVFFCIKTNKPNPAEDDKPETAEPRVIIPFINIPVIKTETAQLGIKPIIPVITG